jgi:hypothetical protein
LAIPEYTGQPNCQFHRLSRKIKVKNLNVFGVVGLSVIITCFGCRKEKIIPPIKIDNTPQLLFSKTFGGEREEYFGTIVRTADGGYLMAGSTASANGSGDIPSTPAVGGNLDMFIVKTGADGNKQWVTTIGGDNNDYARSIAICPDGSGYMIAGNSASSSSGDIPDTRGQFDMAVVKIDLNGKKQWVKTFGGNGSDEAHSITVSKDGRSFLIAGSSTTDNNGDIPKIHTKQFAFFSEIIVLSLNPDGNLQWIKNYGGNFNEDVRSIVASPDGSGYIMAGYTSSDNSGDIPPAHDKSNGLSDMLVLKIGLEGTKQWAKTFGGKGFDFATDVVPKQGSNGYVVTGMVESNGTGDIPISQGESDMIAIELDADGNKQWLKTYGGNDIDDAFAITAIPGGDYLLTGHTASNENGDVPKNHTAGINSMDLMMVRLAPDGNKKWVRTYGGSSNDQGTAATMANDGSFVICGLTASNNNFDVPANHGGQGINDAWVIKVRD